MTRPVWLDIARGELGQREVRGGENPRIIGYHATTSLKATEDEVPWCSSFVNWCLRQASVKGTGSAAAASWLTWGKDAPDAPVGAIVVLRRRDGQGDRGTGSSTGYHVGFLLGATPRTVTVLGGNQGDAVSEATFSRETWRVVAVRWPA